MGLRLANRAELLLLSHIDFRAVNRFGCGLLSNTVDVVGLIGNIRNVHVDEVEADLAELG